MVNLNNWSHALQNAGQNQNVQLGEMPQPQQSGKVESGGLAGRTIQLVPQEKQDVRNNRETREKLFQALKNDVGTTEAESAFIERMRADLGISKEGVAQGDRGLKALEARTIVNLGRAQEKNVSALLNKAMDAIRDRVPRDVMSSIKATILQQANHPDVVAFLDKYGTGGRDLRLLQRVFDLALQTDHGDRFAQAYMRGFRGAERASAPPLAEQPDVELTELRAQSDLEEQQAHDLKKGDLEKKVPVVRPEESGNVEKPKTAQKTVGGVTLDKIATEGKSKTGVMSRKEILGDLDDDTKPVRSENGDVKGIAPHGTDESEVDFEKRMNVGEDELDAIFAKRDGVKTDEQPHGNEVKMEVGKPQTDEIKQEKEKKIPDETKVKKGGMPAKNTLQGDVKKTIADLKAKAHEQAEKYRKMEESHRALCQTIKDKMKSDRITAKALPREMEHAFWKSKKQLEIQSETAKKAEQLYNAFAKKAETALKKPIPGTGQKTGASDGKQKIAVGNEKKGISKDWEILGHPEIKIGKQPKDEDFLKDFEIIEPPKSEGDRPLIGIDELLKMDVGEILKMDNDKIEVLEEELDESMKNLELEIEKEEQGEKDSEILREQEKLDKQKSENEALKKDIDVETLKIKRQMDEIRDNNKKFGDVLKKYAP